LGAVVGLSNVLSSYIGQALFALPRSSSIGCPGPSTPID
jgi:hypothetical protein